MTGDGATADDQPASAAELLAHEIRRLRNAAGLSQPQLAEAVGYTRQYVSLAERAGKNLPSRDLVSALDKALQAGGALLKLREQAKVDQLAWRRGVLEGPPAIPHGQQRVAAERVRRSQEEWLRVRQAPGVRGRELTELAAWLYPVAQRAPGGHVLADRGWLLDEPVDLDSVRLLWSETQVPVPQIEPLDHVLPMTDRGERYAGYSRAVRDLVRPRLLENRLSYRLLNVQTQNALSLTFGTTTFFEVFNVKQMVAHEFKAAWLTSDRSVPTWDSLPLRSTIGDPFDPQRLLMSPGISTLTIRRDRSGEHRFVLHERDGGKVADGGGLCHVMPAGEFQPSSMHPADLANDFSLWRNIMREFSEEFLGNPEHDGNSTAPTEYASEEPFRSFERARAAGRFHLWHYGLVIEPLELGAIQLTVAVVDDEVFDQLFAHLVRTNDEGRLVGAGGRTDMPFTEEAIDRLDPRLSASALTLLRLAWRDRQRLLQPTT
ncbi:MAG: transcriptional regulator [Actinophytocola sp.]|uniref:helix-turn-helix transcriptional regulator n=1 Tax=Actinophytocola sp. TaxID=1872138 RepID=UPI003C748826